MVYLRHGLDKGESTRKGSNPGPAHVQQEENRGEFQVYGSQILVYRAFPQESFKMLIPEDLPASKKYYIVGLRWGPETTP